MKKSVIGLGWSLLEIIIYGLVFLLVTLLFTQALQWIMGAPPLSSELTEDLGKADPLQMLLHNYIPAILGALVGWYVTHILLFKRSIASGGFEWRNIGNHSILGWIYGAATIGFGGGVIFLMGYIQFEAPNYNAYLFWGFLLFFLVQCATEEVMMRSFLIPMLTHRFNVWVALLISSSIFSIVHFDNPNFTWISSVDIFFGGLVTGLLFIYYRSFWAATGFHTAWNYLQSTFLDFNVSGIDVPSWITFAVSGPEYLSGGDFGYEGSIISIVMLAIVAIPLFLKVLEKEKQAPFKDLVFIKWL